MDRITESMMNEFCTEREILSLPDDKKFERFTAFLTIGRHCDQSFDTEEVTVGAAAGIDAIGIIVNGDLITDMDGANDAESSTELDVTFVFLQADRSPNFDAMKIGNFGYAVNDFFKVEPKLPRNPEVKDAAEIMSLLYQRSSKFKKGNPLCRLYFATTGAWTNDKLLQARIDTVKSDLAATGLFRDVTFTPMGADAIQRQFRQAKNAIQREFTFEKRVVAPVIPGVQQAYMGFIPFKEFLSVLTDDDGNMIESLFNSNPRDWQGYDNTVNSEIQQTLESTARNRFVLMNNGITIIAQEIKPTGDKFWISDYQIVNGCQTSHVLFDAKSKLDDSVMIPVRLIGTQDEEAIKSIIKATNRQTQVTDDQFFGIEEFPKQLEDYFQSFPDKDKKLYYERRSLQYERLSIEKTRIITQPNVIRAFAAMFLGEAHSTTKSYSALKAKVGKAIFGKGHRMEPYYTAAFSLYRVEFMFRNKKIEPKYKPARFHILLAARLLSANENTPLMNSHEMDKYCQGMLRTLWDQTASDQLLGKAVQVIKDVAQEVFTRDNIRTETFTNKVVIKCREIRLAETPTSESAGS